ncbi:MAG: class I SAM-dependent DNA methyltransferase [Candidatus Pacebacteria bacterium]|nr:class I SAM-dependent DNA methyltransferase [Candidatus Paceibacterota bacterium]
MNKNSSHLAKWIEKRYFTLQEKFKKNTFTFADASKALFDSYHDSERQTKLILSELKRAGYLNVSKNPTDEREKIYQLVDIFQTSNNLTRDELTNILKAAADIIRTRVDYTFILLLLFYKAVSDKWEIQYQEKYKDLIKDGWREEEAVKEASQPYYHSFYLTPDLLWNNLRKDPLKLPENFSKNLKEIAELNPEYKDIFLQFDFHTFTSNQENSAILNNLFELFSKYSFESTSSDILGDAYEWILKYFAPQKAKEGEIFTPREVIRLMVEILSPEPEKYIYDPAVGSAGMLIITYQYVKENYSKEKADTLFLRGQEQNGKTLALAKMNAILHDIRNIELLEGDTLLYPKFKSADGVKKFNYTIANPPWNQKGYDEDTLKKGEYWRERFIFGFPTKQSADWAWIQHMLASTKDDGKTVVVIDTGAVSRSGREKNIRQKILEKDLFEAVILLPEKLFYNTGAPGLIIVFNKNKLKKRKNKILLINATKEFVAGKPQNTLGKENIKKITDVYKDFKEVENLSKIISLDEAEKNDYNLSPSRYVSITEEEQYRPIEEIVKELKEIEDKRQKVDKKINEILRKIKL